MRKFLFIIWAISSTISFAQSPMVKQDSIVEFIDIPAEFPGGNIALMRFIQNALMELEIDSSTFQCNRIYLTFTVEIDGAVTSLQVVDRKNRSILKNGASPFDSMPKWKPAFHRDNPVRERIRIPIIIEYE